MMHKFRCFRTAIVRVLLLLGVVFYAGWALAQAKPSRTPATAPVDERTLDDLHQQLVKLLRITPALTGAVSHDPSLLSDQQYVARTNPALAQFLELHPEVASNPEFYLFAKVKGENRRNGLRREVWPEMVREYHQSPWDDFWPVLAIAIIAIALLWLIRLVVHNSRWKRALKVQNDMQNKLLDKFGSNQELIAYLDTEAGKRILQVATMPSGSEAAPAGGMLGRMLTPLQFGAALIPIGIGLELLRNRFPGEAGLVVIATLVLSLGIGLCVAALVSWFLARRYGLLPQAAANAASHQQEQR